jgi:hypothetical protein
MAAVAHLRVGQMKRSTRVTVGILAMISVATVLTIAYSWGDGARLHIDVVASKSDASGGNTISFIVTNGNSRPFPWFAFATVATPNGEAPYFAVETKTRDGWKRTSNVKNYSFTHYLLPNHSWEFQASLAQSEQPRRMVLFYTVAVRQDRPWIHRQTRELLKTLGLAKDTHELRSEVLQANKIVPANGSQPIRSETNRTSSAAGSRR